MKLIYAPISILSGLLAGTLSKKAFARLWALVDDAQPPTPKQRDTTWPKLLGALLLQGAIFRVVRGAVDHAARRGFAGLTGSWPGDKSSDAGS